MNTHPDFPGSESDCERQARALGNDRAALLARLRDGAKTLVRERVSLAKWRYDFDAKTLSSPDGRFCVQWELRRWPDRPIAYENQQTNSGNCHLVQS